MEEKKQTSKDWKGHVEEKELTKEVEPYVEMKG